VRIDLPENYAVRNARRSIQDSLMSHGEECVLLSCYHVNLDHATRPRCPECYDDLYEAGQKQDCGTCYGTTFLGGVKNARRAWAIFTDAADEEALSKHGLWHPVARKMQTEYLPDIWQHDFVARVTSWTTDHRPRGIEGIYVMASVNNESLRTGNRPGQIAFDAIAQNAQLERLAEQMPIYRYPLVGVRFDRHDTAPNEADFGVGGVALADYSPSIVSGAGPPTQASPGAGTIYLDTTTGDLYRWDP
jgi:hypothetical protein